MPAIIRQEGKLQLRDQDMVDLILRVHGAWTGNNVVAPRQGFGADQFQQQAGHRAVVIPEHDELIRQCLCSALMAQAKSCHDELETYYRAAVDFGKVDEAAAECMEMFGLK